MSPGYPAETSPDLALIPYEPPLSATIQDAWKTYYYFPPDYPLGTGTYTTFLHGDALLVQAQPTLIESEGVFSAFAGAWGAFLLNSAIPRLQREDMVAYLGRTIRQLVLGNNTTIPLLPHNAKEALQRIFADSWQEHFEDGVRSGFAEKVMAVVKRHGGDAVGALASLMLNGQVGNEPLSEALRWVARLDDAPTYAYRLWLLEKALSSSSAKVRDAAILGLTHLGDPQSLDALRSALKNETVQELSDDMRGLIGLFEKHTG